MKIKLLFFSLIFILLCLCGCASKENTSVPSHSKDFFAMDTHMRITVYGENKSQLPELAEKEIKRLEALLSAHTKTSELAQLKAKRSLKLSAETASLVEHSLKLNKAMQGAFDITLAPISKLWGFPNGPYHVPTDAELKASLKATGMQKIVFDKTSRTCTLTDDQVSLDLGGIAKGYAAEKAAELLTKQGCQSAVLNLGGNVKVLGTKPGGALWHIGVQHPDNKDGYLGVLALRDNSVVTSGDYERYFEADNVRYHHILNPQTGLPANNSLRSVTIVCPDSTQADSLSTALFVLGPRKAIDYWQQHKKEFNLILYTTAGKVLISEELAPSFTTDLPCTILK